MFHLKQITLISLVKKTYKGLQSFQRRYQILVPYCKSNFLFFLTSSLSSISPSQKLYTRRRQFNILLNFSVILPCGVA